MHREASDTSADGIRIVTSSNELYAIAKRLCADPASVTPDEVVVMAAYLVTVFENDP